MLYCKTIHAIKVLNTHPSTPSLTPLPPNPPTPSSTLCIWLWHKKTKLPCVNLAIFFRQCDSSWYFFRHYDWPNIRHYDRYEGVFNDLPVWHRLVVQGSILRCCTLLCDRHRLPLCQFGQLIIRYIFSLSFLSFRECWTPPPAANSRWYGLTRHECNGVFWLSLARFSAGFSAKSLFKKMPNLSFYRAEYIKIQ